MQKQYKCLGTFLSRAKQPTFFMIHSNKSLLAHDVWWCWREPWEKAAKTRECASCVGKRNINKSQNWKARVLKSFLWTITQSRLFTKRVSWVYSLRPPPWLSLSQLSMALKLWGSYSNLWASVFLMVVVRLKWKVCKALSIMLDTEKVPNKC